VLSGLAVGESICIQRSGVAGGSRRPQFARARGNALLQAAMGSSIIDSTAVGEAWRMSVLCTWALRGDILAALWEDRERKTGF